jgi:hypothetical protein
MIERLTKNFQCEFGIDEKIEVLDFELKGSKGYVSQIKIDRNGIWYECVLTQVIDKLSEKKAKRDIYSPKGVTLLGSMLKSMENI